MEAKASEVGCCDGGVCVCVFALIILGSAIAIMLVNIFVAVEFRFFFARCRLVLFYGVFLFLLCALPGLVRSFPLL